MNVALRDFKQADQCTLSRWVEGVNATQYMSRFAPKLPVFARFVIQADGEDVGTVWVEKESPDDPEAVLGILIGQESRLGKGIGRKAIGLALERAQPLLHFRTVRLNVRKSNTRAIACYEKCGFRITREGEGRNQLGEMLHFYEMRAEAGQLGPE